MWDKASHFRSELRLPKLPKNRLWVTYQANTILRTYLACWCLEVLFNKLSFSLTPLLLLQLNHLNDNPVLFLINKIVVKFPYPIPTCLHIKIISFTTKWEAFVFKATQCEVLSVMLENSIYFNTIPWCLIQFIQISFPQQILLVSSFLTLLRLSYINTVLFLSTRTTVLAIYPVYNHFTLSNIILLSYFAKSAAVIVLKGRLGNPGLTYWFHNHLRVTTCPDCQCQVKGIWSCI